MCIYSRVDHYRVYRLPNVLWHRAKICLHIQSFHSRADIGYVQLFAQKMFES